MRQFIFGMDQQEPEKCADGLRAKGMDAVVLGGMDARAARALKNAGLAGYLCFGALSLGQDAETEARWALDAQEHRRRWFSSGCPCDEEIRERNLQAVLQAAQALPALSGIFVDGARFASFASPEGEAGFFTCFCPRCMQKMKARGLDAAGIRRAVSGLQLKKRLESADAPLIADWFRFRGAVIREMMERFCAAVKGMNPRWQTGAFVFAPSLAPWVGQGRESLGAPDLISPMLYRHYPHAQGPACLGHEWAGALHALGGAARDALACAAENAASGPRRRALMQAIDFSAPPERFLQHGFAPGHAALEAAATREEMLPAQRLLPILQLEDRQLPETIAGVQAAGADGWGLFMYGQADF